MSTQNRQNQGQSKKQPKHPVIILPEARLSFPSLFQKRAFKEGDTPKLECTLLWAKNQNLGTVRKLMEAEALKKFGTIKGVKFPIMDGDNKGGDASEQYAGHFYAHAKSQFGVAVIDMDRNDITEEDCYAGCYVKVSVAVKADEWKDPKNPKLVSKYVKFLLRAVMKTKDGEPFSQRGNAAEDFDNVGADDPSNYSNDNDNGLNLEGSDDPLADFM